MGEMISQSEFSRRMGWSPPNTFKYVKRGVLELENGLLDFEKSKQAIQDNVTRIQSRKAKKELSMAPEIGNKEMSLTKLKAYHESIRAKKSKLELDQLEGSLIDAKAVKDASFKQARLVRDTLLGVADRLSPVVANEKDQHRVHEIIHEEIVFCLRAISGKSQSIRAI